MRIVHETKSELLTESIQKPAKAEAIAVIVSRTGGAGCRLRGGETRRSRVASDRASESGIQILSEELEVCDLSLHFTDFE